MDRGKGIIGILLLAVLSPGCSCDRTEYPPRPVDAQAGSLVLESGTFETETGEYEADFGTLVVPENRGKADSRLIELPVVRIRASGKNPGEPIFGLRGGPGSSNMSPGFLSRDSFLSDHDIVMVGYRGVDGSVILDCPEVKKALNQSSGDLLSEESLRIIGEAYDECGSRLREKEGIDIDGYTMIEVIEDMEAARTALGYERINLLSRSYGTRVAYLYGLRYPDRIHRSAMVGANPPGHFGWESATIDAQLEYYAALWARDSTISARTGDLAATMRSVTRNMPERWLVFGIDPGKVRVMTFVLLFHRDTAALAFDAFVAAHKGDPSGLALLSMAYRFFIPSSGVWGDHASKAVSADFDPSRDYFVEMDPPGSIIGSPMGELAWGISRFVSWPIQPIPEEYRRSQTSDVETLLLSGSIDFSTPAEFATNELLPCLRNGKQVILAEMGHSEDVFGVNPEATERLLTSFFDTGVPDT